MSTTARSRGTAPVRKSTPPPPQSRGVSVSPWTISVVLVAAMIGMSAALVFGGAAAPRQVADPGALVRWGLPVVETVHNIAMSVVMGGLLLAMAAATAHCVRSSLQQSRACRYSRSSNAFSVGRPVRT